MKCKALLYVITLSCIYYEINEIIQQTAHTFMIQSIVHRMPPIFRATVELGISRIRFWRDPWIDNMFTSS